jgi:hypothetical protein
MQPADVLEVLDGDLSEEQAWNYVKKRYAGWLQKKHLAGTWTVAPRKAMGEWRIEIFREE